MKTRSKLVNKLLVEAIYISAHEGLIQVFFAEARDCHHLWKHKRFIEGELAAFYPYGDRWVLYNSGFIPSTELLTTVSVLPYSNQRISHIRRKLSD